MSFPQFHGEQVISVHPERADPVRPAGRKPAQTRVASRLYEQVDWGATHDLETLQARLVGRGSAHG